MQAVGFFRELGHGLPAGPSLHDAIADPLPPGERSAVAGYLRACHVLAATSVMADDALDPDRRSVSPIDVHTDGDAVWPEDFAYYVEEYGARPPADLLERARTGTVPDVPREQLDAVIAWMQQGMPSTD
jgi:hypothetical protein